MSVCLADNVTIGLRPKLAHVNDDVKPPGTGFFRRLYTLYHLATFGFSLAFIWASATIGIRIRIYALNSLHILYIYIWALSTANGNST